MVFEVLFFAFTIIGINTSSSLSGSYFQLSSPSCKKCPAGSFTLCSQNEESRCEKCPEGTYTEKPSRRGTCKRCARCAYNEFESLSCNSTSNTVCVKCRKCPLGFGVFRPCEKRRDTDCVKCPVSEGWFSGYLKTDCGFKAGYGVGTDIKRKERPKDTFVVVKEEINPWEKGRKKPKTHHKLAFVKKHVNTSIFVSAIPSIDPAPSSVFFSTKSTSAVDLGTVLVSSAIHSSASSSRSVESSVTPPAGEIIGPTLGTDIPSKRRPPSRSTEKSDSSLKTSTNFGLQGDDGNIPSRGPRNIRQNRTDATTTGVTSPVSPPERVKTRYINNRGMDDEHSTESYHHRSTRWRLGTDTDTATLVVTNNKGHIEVDIPPPTKEVRASDNELNRPVSHHSRHWLWIVGTFVSVAFLATSLALKQWKHLKKTKGCFFTCPRPNVNCRRPPRCVQSSDCCDGASISSASGAYMEQTETSTRSKYTEEDETEDNLPTSHPTQYILPHTGSNLVIADVHHTSQFDGLGTRSLSYITEAEARFDSSGGKLSAPDSDVVITVGSGAVPEGNKQPFFFRVPKYDTTLLQDIPEMPEGTLISPVIECGPHGLTLLKPVEITVPHDLCLDKVRKDSIRVYRCEPSSEGPLKWERVPSASERNCPSKAWFTVKKNSIHIKTTTFSRWSVFACGGTKRKRARVYFSRHNTRSDHIYLRFYIYSDNEDSKKRVKEQEKESFPGHKSSKEKPFKMCDDETDVIVKLTDLQDGWELDKTPSVQRYDYETAYRNGFRAKDACDFAVKPARPGVDEFSCNLKFNQEDSSTEYSIYLYPGYTPRQTSRKTVVESSGSDSPSNGCEVVDSVSITITEENGINGSQESTTLMDESRTDQTEYFSRDMTSLGSNRQPATEEHFNCIRGETGLKWKVVLRKLDVKEALIDSICVNHREYGVQEMFYQGLLEWKECFGEKATTKKLCDVLREARCTEALKKLREVVECDAAAPVQESAASPWTTV